MQQFRHPIPFKEDSFGVWNAFAQKDLEHVLCVCHTLWLRSVRIDDVGERLSTTDASDMTGIEGFDGAPGLRGVFITLPRIVQQQVSLKSPSLAVFKDLAAPMMPVSRRHLKHVLDATFRKQGWIRRLQPTAVPFFCMSSLY